VVNTSASDAGVHLDLDPRRVVAQLFLPGDSTPGSSSRTQGVLERALAMSADEVAAAAAAVLRRFQPRHPDLPELLRRNADTVRAVLAAKLSPDQEIFIGSIFTAEFAVEGAALCNPSVVAHPNQDDLEPGQLRVVVSLRSIGEGHLSSIQFCEAIIGPGRRWEFQPRELPLVLPQRAEGRWRREHLVRALESAGPSGELAHSVALALPETFGSRAVELAVQELPAVFMSQPAARSQLEAIRVVAGSAYRATFAPGTSLSQRVLLPAADEESRGVEDARFVGFTDATGQFDYRATYTAYDGRGIATRLLVTNDFRTFEVQRMTGTPAETKGMALFPRPVGGRLLALGRGDGEAVSLSSSTDGLDWGPEEPVHGPGRIWDLVQGGNCGSPLETDWGWLVLTHGVGPLRAYSIGAVLLDLDDPGRVIAILPTPLLEPAEDDWEGYVPNVVYTCGAIIHEQTLWIPYGVADCRVRVASIPLAELIAGMVSA
jgi:predicted GH43/DUF377 family glycosyl hydrolase